MVSLAPRRGFVRSWWLYAVGIYFIWCQLAGVGCVLALAFLSDSGPGLADYLRAVGHVALVLFVAPLPFVMALAAILAALHLGIAWTIWGRRSEPVTGPRPSAFSSSERGPADDATQSRYSGDGFWKIVARLLARASIVCGVFIVATNAPREVARNGLGPAITTSLIFLVPLVFAPLAFLLSGRRVAMPERSDAADSR
jgi:hypothetical protein